MATSNLEALNELITNIGGGRKAGSNLEALNALCVICGGTGLNKTNLDALNELLTVFHPGTPLQEKSITITENGATAVTPDDGFGLSRVDIDTNVPSTPTQSKAVTISKNGTTVITPDPGYAMFEVVADVSVSSEGGYNISAPVYYQDDNGGIYHSITEVDLTGVNKDKPYNWSGMFRDASRLKTIKWGGFFDGLLPTANISAANMFYGCSSIEAIDMSACPETNLTEVRYMFQACTSVKQIKLGGLKINTNNISYMFSACYALESLDLSNMVPTYLYNLSNTFYDCRSLTNIIFPPDLFKNGNMMSVDLSYSPLTRDCVVDMFNKLAARTNSPAIKLSTTTKDTLSEEDLAIATGKGWVIS